MAGKDAAKAREPRSEPVRSDRDTAVQASEHDALMLLGRSAGNRALTGLLQRSSGKALDPATRREMESRFGEDFNDVRVHADAAASAAAALVSSNAFTSGPDIFFGDSFYATGSQRGKVLIAHELAHVVQQRRGGAAAPPTFDRTSAAEQDAASVAKQFAGPGPVSVNSGTGTGVARQEAEEPWWRKRLNPIYQRALEVLPKAAAEKLEEANETARTFVGRAGVGDASLNQAVNIAEPVLTPIADYLGVKPDAAVPKTEDTASVPQQEADDVAGLDAGASITSQKQPDASSEADLDAGAASSQGALAEADLDAGAPSSPKLLTPPKPNYINQTEGGVYLLPADQAQREHADLIEGGAGRQADAQAGLVPTMGGADVQAWRHQEFVIGAKSAIRHDPVATLAVAGLALATLPFNEQRAEGIASLLSGPEPTSDIAELSETYTGIGLGIGESLGAGGVSAAAGRLRPVIARAGGTLGRNLRIGAAATLIGTGEATGLDRGAAAFTEFGEVSTSGFVDDFLAAPSSEGVTSELADTSAADLKDVGSEQVSDVPLSDQKSAQSASDLDLTSISLDGKPANDVLAQPYWHKAEVAALSQVAAENPGKITNVNLEGKSNFAGIDILSEGELSSVKAFTGPSRTRRYLGHLVEISGGSGGTGAQSIAAKAAADIAQLQKATRGQVALPHGYANDPVAFIEQNTVFRIPDDHVSETREALVSELTDPNNPYGYQNYGLPAPPTAEEANAFAARRIKGVGKTLDELLK